MRVLQINSVCGNGSTGKIVLDIHNTLLENGHESWIAYGRGDSNGVLNSIRIGTAFDNYIHVANTRLLDRHGFSSTKATRQLLKTIDEIKPDIIHLHNLHGYYINIEILFNYLKVRNIPVIWTLHDCWTFTGHCTHYEYVQCNKWKTGCYDCPQKREYPASYIIDGSRRNYRDKQKLFTNHHNLTIVAPSQWLTNQIDFSYMTNYNIEVINNGIDLSIFQPTFGSFRFDHNLEDKYIILAVASIWTERKGYNDYLKLAHYLADDEVIVLVGLNEGQINHLPNNIIGVRKTKNAKELAEIYSTANIFLNLTLEDTYPTVNIEASACGTYVLTRDVGGCKETIETDMGEVIVGNSISDIYLNIKKIKATKNITKAIRYNDKNISIDRYLELYGRLSET